MAVRRDKNGTWRYRKVVRMPDGTKVRISGTPTIHTKLEAERAEREHIQRVLNPPPERKEVPTFAKFVEEKWWPTYPKAASNRPMTVREKEIHIRRHLKPALGSLPLTAIRGEPVDRFFAKLGDNGLREKSRKNVRATLRRILASAVEWGYLDAVPPLPKVKVPEARFDHYSQEEGDALLAAARNDEERLLLLFALHTGARAGELLALEWGDIDWRSRKLIFRRSATRGIVGPTKSGRERKVPMTATLEAALRKHRHLRGALVFCNPDGSAMTLWQLHERLEVTCKRAGLRKVRWHDLRHSFASQLVTLGIPIRQVQEWLGHATITMTMRFAHLAPGGDSALIAALDRAEPNAAWQKRGND
jgi:integrase